MSDSQFYFSSHKQEVLEVGKSGEEDKKGTDETVHEDEGSKNASEDVNVNEGGKKDPFTRRKELLIDSGLAEVCIYSSRSSI